MKPWGGSILIAAACLAVADGPALAQDRAPGQDDILVTGQRGEEPARRDISRQARAITRPQNMYDVPLARFQNRLCPGVMGLRTDHALMVVDRIRAHATDLKMWMAPDDGTCRPNFIVAFVRNGQQQMAELIEANGYLFADVPLQERRELIEESGPVRVWSVIETRTRDGMPVPKAQSLSEPPVVSMWMAHSKIYTATREDIASVLVVFDLEQIQGKTLVQLADYAAMRGLARTRPVEGDGQPMDTILALFDESAPPPPQMTDFDRAYLASVYDGIPNIPGITKILGVNRQLRLQAKNEE